MQRKRTLNDESKEMLIKTKATGSDSIAPDERLYLSVHFTESLEFLNREQVQQGRRGPHPPQPTVVYVYFSKYKSLGEVLQFLWQTCCSTMERTEEFRQNPRIQHLRRQDIALGMITSDTPDWHRWDRRVALKDCLTNYEDIAVFPLPMADVIASQNALPPRGGSNPTNITAAVSNSVTSSTSTAPVVYEKGQLVWYHKVPKEVVETMSPVQMEHNHPMILVRISGVHHDDYPNIYYSVQLKTPVESTQVPGADKLVFEHEKQTDSAHLCPSSQQQQRASSSSSAAPSAASTSSTRGMGQSSSGMNPTQMQTADELQQTLSTMGPPVQFKIVYKAQERLLVIGSNCTVAQLKLLISAYTGVQVPDMKLISNGIVLKNNHQQVKQTRLTKGAKIMVMNAGSHTV
mmetsp:Transcript_1489/g.2498  ORF Transcript_1489/g.2498 Transcript_1489/m.2498 type:complete len:403 (+) Transcript_1489:53-1261(+)